LPTIKLGYEQHLYRFVANGQLESFIFFFRLSFLHQLEDSSTGTTGIEIRKFAWIMDKKLDALGGEAFNGVINGIDIPADMMHALSPGIQETGLENPALGALHQFEL
jgi:hypothetical protein